jgi:hypothetical protein
MFTYFYGEELVDPTTTQGSLQQFQQGKIIKLLEGSALFFESKISDRSAKMRAVKRNK